MKTRFTKTEMTRLLGLDVGEFVFRGQCYDMGAGKARTCGLTGKNIRFCFTIHPRNGARPRATIGTAAFLYLRRWNPELWVELEKGRQFLMLQVEGERRDKLDTVTRVSLTEVEKEWKKLSREAHQRIESFKMLTGKAYLPEGLFNLRVILERNVPGTNSGEALQTWYKAQMQEFKLHLEATTTVLTDLAKKAAAPQKELVTAQQNKLAVAQQEKLVTPLIFEEIEF